MRAGYLPSAPTGWEDALTWLRNAVRGCALSRFRASILMPLLSERIASNPDGAGSRDAQVGSSAGGGGDQ